MEIPFTKMAGAGNDFVVLDNRGGTMPEGAARADLVRAVCHRRLSVGADGVLFLENAADAHFRMRYYNADGGEADMCGNGGRCIARFAYLHGVARADMVFRSAAGVHHAQIRDENVKLGMTPPHSAQLNRSVQLPDGKRILHCLNTGVPHAVEFLPRIDEIDVVQVGREIRFHDAFRPAGTNANFVQAVDRHSFLIRTYERGVEDETLACGTGTTAAAILGSLLGLFDPPVVGTTRSGVPLTIHFRMDGDAAEEVYLEGDARVAFVGSLSTK